MASSSPASLRDSLSQERERLKDTFELGTASESDGDLEPLHRTVDEEVVATADSKCSYMETVIQNKKYRSAP